MSTACRCCGKAHAEHNRLQCRLDQIERLRAKLAECLEHLEVEREDARKRELACDAETISAAAARSAKLERAGDGPSTPEEMFYATAAVMPRIIRLSTNNPAMVLDALPAIAEGKPRNVEAVNAYISGKTFESVGLNFDPSRPVSRNQARTLVQDAVRANRGVQKCLFDIVDAAFPNARPTPKARRCTAKIALQTRAAAPEEG